MKPVSLIGTSRVWTVYRNILYPFLLNGNIMFILSFQNNRGEQTQLTYLDETRVMLKYSLPLSEIVIDFYDQLKSLSSGYARYLIKFCYCGEYCHSYWQKRVILLSHEYEAWLPVNVTLGCSFLLPRIKCRLAITPAIDNRALFTQRQPSWCPLS